MKGKWYEKFFIIGVFFFLYLPIIVLIFFSFNDSTLNIVFEGFTLKWYKTLLENTTLIEAFKNTLIVALTSTVLSTLLGTISAVGLYKYNFKLKGLINKLIYVPIVIPEIVLGISLLSVYNLMKMRLGMISLIIAHITFSTPYVLVSVRSTLNDMNPYLDEASHDLGANVWQTFFNVILPGIMPGILSGAMLAFTLSMDDVVISYFTAGPESNTLPLFIYSIIKSGVTPSVNALLTIMLVITFTIVTVYSVISYKRRLKHE